uniref:ZP domain-containing protein n=1 Tax=Plectus sambesii TaxID=2011161 RepID=A0A914XCB2_9BILA
MFADALEDFLNVYCTEEMITVSLQLTDDRMTDAMAEIINKGRLSFAGNDDSLASFDDCYSRIDSTTETLRLSSAYLGACAITADHTGATTTVYRAQVDFIGYHNATLNVECRIPKDLGTLTEAPVVELKLYHNRGWSESSALVNELTIGHTINGEVTARLPWNIASDVFTYPVQCWTTDVRNNSSSDKSFFLKEGCPNLDASNRGMATLIHDLTQPGRTRFSFPFKWDLVPKRLREMSSGPLFSPIFIHCDVIMCSGPKTVGFVGIPNCPKSTFCNGDSIFTHKLPDHLKLFSSFHALQGPVTARERQSAPTADCKVQCAKEKQSSSAAQFLTQTKATVPEIIPHYHMGVETWAASLVAVASFVFGMATVAIIWLIHVNTVPKNKLNSLERTDSASFRNEIRSTHPSNEACDSVAMLSAL